MSAGVVFVGDDAGVLHAIDAATGQELWSYATGGAILGRVVTAGDDVLVGSHDGELRAVVVPDPGSG